MWPILSHFVYCVRQLLNTKNSPVNFLNTCNKLSVFLRFKEPPYLSCAVCFTIYSASTNRSTVNYWLDNSRWRTYWCRQQFISYPHLSICETADWYDLRLAYDGWCSKSFDDTVSTTEINRVITWMINGRGKGDREGGVDTCFKFLVLDIPYNVGKTSMIFIRIRHLNT